MCGRAVTLVCTLFPLYFCSCDKVSSSLTASARVYFQVCSGSYLGVGTTAVFKSCRLLHPPVVRHLVLPGRSRPFLSSPTSPSSLRLPYPSSFRLPTLVPVPSLLGRFWFVLSLLLVHDSVFFSVSLGTSAQCLYDCPLFETLCLFSFLSTSLVSLLAMCTFTSRSLPGSHIPLGLHAL